MTPQPNQRWNGPIRGARKYRLPPKDPKPCPRCYAPCRLTPAGWECAKHGLVPEAAA